MPTPQIETIRAAVTARFPRAVDGGIDSCRKVAGSSRWSQHAYGNAWDIFGPGRTATRPDKNYLDSIYWFLNNNRAALQIDELIWEHRGGGSAAAHQDHIHVSAKPKQTGTPACAGGTPTATPVFTNPGTQEYFEGLEDEARADGRHWTQRDDALGTVGRGLEAYLNAGAAFSYLVSVLTDPQQWVRIGLVFGGGVLTILGLILIVTDKAGLDDLAALVPGPTGAAAKAAAVVA